MLCVGFGTNGVFGVYTSLYAFAYPYTPVACILADLQQIRGGCKRRKRCCSYIGVTYMYRCSTFI